MNVTLSINEHEFILSGKFVDLLVNPNWGDGALRYKFKITIEYSRSGKSFSTDYWSSISDVEKCNNTITYDLLLDAFHCIVMDALAYIQEEEITTDEAYNGCMKTYENFQNIGNLTEDDLCEILNYLHDLDIM